MYTPAGQGQAESALRTFEQVYYFFDQKFKGEVKLENRVRIVAFTSEKDFKPYRPNEGTFAFYQQGQARDYIVMQDIEKEHAKAAIHEYTHLAVAHEGLKLPAWLDEGLADLYSSVEPHGRDAAMIGRPLDDEYVLFQQKWMDWGTLLRVDHDSPYYNEKNKMSVFYAQSWLLTHMLDLSPAYGAGFGKFLGAVVNGMSSEEAFRKVYGKNLQDLNKDVEAYFHQQTVRAAILPISLPKEDLDADIQPLPDFDRDLALAELKASSRNDPAQGRAWLAVLEKSHPESLELHEALGWAALQDREELTAREEFVQAAQHGSANSELYYQLAGLQMRAHDPVTDAIASLQQSLRLNPNNDETRLFLASLLTQNGKYGLAISTLALLHHLKPEQAYHYYSMMAFCNMNLKNPKNAKVLADKAMQYAKTDQERNQATELVTWTQRAADAADAAK